MYMVNEEYTSRTTTLLFHPIYIYIYIVNEEYTVRILTSPRLFVYAELNVFKHHHLMQIILFNIDHPFAYRSKYFKVILIIKFNTRHLIVFSEIVSSILKDKIVLFDPYILL